MKKIWLRKKSMSKTSHLYPFRTYTARKIPRISWICNHQPCQPTFWIRAKELLTIKSMACPLVGSNCSRSTLTKIRTIIMLVTCRHLERTHLNDRLSLRRISMQSMIRKITIQCTTIQQEEPLKWKRWLKRSQVSFIKRLYKAASQWDSRSNLVDLSHRRLRNYSLELTPIRMRWSNIRCSLRWRSVRKIQCNHQRSLRQSLTSRKWLKSKL